MEQQTSKLTVAAMIKAMVERTHVLGMPSIANTKTGQMPIANLPARLARNGRSS
jgi:hypothetical protein